MHTPRNESLTIKSQAQNEWKGAKNVDGQKRVSRARLRWGFSSAWASPSCSSSWAGGQWRSRFRPIGRRIRDCAHRPHFVSHSKTFEYAKSRPLYKMGGLFRRARIVPYAPPFVFFSLPVGSNPFSSYFPCITKETLISQSLFLGAEGGIWFSSLAARRSDRL